MAKKKEEKKVVAPLPKGVTKKKLDKLFRMFCVHSIEFEAGHFVCHWEKCNACILRDIPWKMDCGGIKGIVVRDLCFAIWHEGVLNA